MRVFQGVLRKDVQVSIPGVAGAGALRNATNARCLREDDAIQFIVAHNASTGVKALYTKPPGCRGGGYRTLPNAVQSSGFNLGSLEPFQDYLHQLDHQSTHATLQRQHFCTPSLHRLEIIKWDNIRDGLHFARRNHLTRLLQILSHSRIPLVE